MKNILFVAVLALSLAGCKMTDAVDSVNATPAKMDSMNAKMDKTNHAIHMQTLVASLTEIFKKENTRKLFPAPTSMMPAGKVFAEEATVEELLLSTKNYIKEIQEVSYFKDLDFDGNEIEYSVQDMNDMRAEKYARLYALFIIAGFTPDNVVNEMIQTQQVNGPYLDEMLQFLMLRTIFLRDIILQSDLLSTALNNSGEMDKAVLYLKKLDFVLSQPFVDDISLKVASGAIKVVHPTSSAVTKDVVVLDFEESLSDPASFKATAGMWKKALERAEDGHQKVSSKKWSNDAAQNTAIKAQEVAAQAGVINTLKEGAQVWETRLQ